MYIRIRRQLPYGMALTFLWQPAAGREKQSGKLIVILTEAVLSRRLLSYVKSETNFLPSFLHIS
ncbi:MAG: hypothetical protein A2V64_01905 [Bacteroidetes bacterium RBG_13_43_22]|nr:MAG: hypothetical protein A2V64_01905 [Bacteroidetes bacterium RBG_13_43_22]